MAHPHMDHQAHGRFLEYLEMFQYFKQPGETRLDIETWEALDTQLLELEASSEPDPSRLKELRRALLRD